MVRFDTSEAVYHWMKFNANIPTSDQHQVKKWNGTDRCIILEPGQDPTLLPGFLPCNVLLFRHRVTMTAGDLVHYGRQDAINRQRGPAADHIAAALAPHLTVSTHEEPWNMTTALLFELGVVSRVPGVKK